MNDTIMTLRHNSDVKLSRLKTLSKHKYYETDKKQATNLSHSVQEWSIYLHNFRFRVNKFYLLFVPCLSSCHEKATTALNFGRIRTRLGVVHIRVFRLFL